MRPYLLAASHRTETTNAEARVTNSHPRLASIQVSAEPLAEPRPVGLRNPQATNARARTAETVKTPRSSEPFSSATGAGGWAMAGCWSLRGSGSVAAVAGAVAAGVSDSSRPGGAVGVIVTGACCARAGAPSVPCGGGPGPRSGGGRTRTRRARTATQGSSDNRECANQHSPNGPSLSCCDDAKRDVAAVDGVSRLVRPPWHRASRAPEPTM